MIWFDLDNSPHVPLFRPIFAELGKRREDYFVTARAHAQTEELLQLWSIPHRSVGRHGGKSVWRKLWTLGERSAALLWCVRGMKFSLAVSHGSRSHLLAARLQGVPYLCMSDYEFAEHRFINLLATHILMPVYIPRERLVQAGFNLGKLIQYSGFKEQIYLKDFHPSPAFRKSIGVDESSILITVRPPSITANYHDPRSEVLFRRCLAHFLRHKDAICLVVNRTEAERRLVNGQEANPNLKILDKAVDGLQLLWHSDLVVSGGGTMNREAALLGVPTYSIFTGRRPAMDEYLQQQGRLTFIEEVRQAEEIPVQKRAIPAGYAPTNVGLAAWVTELILDLQDRAVRR